MLWNSVLELLITSITLLVLVVISGVFKKSGAYDFSFFVEIESLSDVSLPSVKFIGNGRTLQASEQFFLVEWKFSTN